MQFTAKKNEQGLRRTLLISCLLAAATWSVYGQTTDFDYVGYDDRLYVVENRQVQNGLSVGSVAWAFTSRQEGNWFPLTRLSHILDVETFGLEPGGHHATNAALHMVNVLLLFGVLRAMTGATGRSAFAAAMFALHPLQVESVAWVSERKTLLCTGFGLLSLWAYAGWTRRGGIGRYLATTGLFALSLMSKPMFVTLPFVFLLVDYWPLERSARTPAQRVVEKLPLFALSAAFSGFTWLTQSAGGAPVSTDALPLPLRLANAIYAYADYLRKSLWPDDLALFYPHPFLSNLGGISLTAWQITVATAVLIAVSVAVAASRRRYATVGWLWFLGTLVPVIGIAQVGGQGMADRYAYQPLIGIFIAVTWGGAELYGSLRDRAPGFAATLIFVPVLLLATWLGAARAQTAHWRDSFSLFDRVLAVTPRNPTIRYNLANALQERGDYAEAADHYRIVLETTPNDPRVYNNRGNALRYLGLFDEAIENYRSALDLQPDYPQAHNNLGASLRALERDDEALEHYREAVRLAPDYSLAHTNLGNTLRDRGDLDLALFHYRRAIAANPGNTVARRRIAEVLALQEERRRDAPRKVPNAASSGY